MRVRVQDSRHEDRRGPIVDLLGQPLGQCGRRLRRDLHHLDPFLGQSIELSANGVEFAIRRDQLGTLL